MFAPAGQAFALSLVEALEATRANNPQLLAARAAVRGTGEGLKQAESAFFPDLDANASISNIERQFSNGTTTRNHPKNYGVTMRQDIFRGFGSVSAARAARNTLKAAEADLLQQEQQVLLNAVAAYMDVLRDLEVVALNRSQVEVLDKQLAATRSRFRLGEVTQTDVQQAEARLAAARASLVSAEGDLVTSRATFEEVVGIEPANLSWPVVGFSLPNTADEVMDKALSAHPAVARAVAQLAARKYNVEGARANYYPVIYAQGTLETNKDASGGLNGDFDNRVVSLNMSVPLFRGGENVSRVRQTIAEREGAEQDYQNIRRAIRRELVDAVNEFRTVKARQVALEDSVEANRLALRGVEKEAEVGARTVLDMLDARQEFLAAQVDLTAAKRNSLVAAFRLKAAMGELSGNHLRGLMDGSSASTDIEVDLDSEQP
jgi:outer membrane protein